MKEKAVRYFFRLPVRLYLTKNKNLAFQDMILLAYELQSDLDLHKKRLKDLEDYLDDLLLRVMETTPRILQNPYVNCKLAHKKLM